MNKKYLVHNQITGLQEEAQTYAEAKVLRARLLQEYLDFNNQTFKIRMLVENPIRIFDTSNATFFGPATDALFKNRDGSVSIYDVDDQGQALPAQQSRTVLNDSNQLANTIDLTIYGDPNG